MMSYKVKDAVGNIYIIKASSERDAIKKFREIKDSKFIGSDGTVDFYEYNNGYYVGNKKIADKKVKDYGTQRRQFRSQDIDEEGSFVVNVNVPDASSVIKAYGAAA
jgi:RPA family protein